jgi:hypothetical protein
VAPVRSSSLVFTAPSLTFACRQVGLRGLPLGRGRMRRGGFIWLDLPQLGSPSELSLRAGCSLLSWDSSACSSPPTFTPGVHSRSPRAPSAEPYQGLGPVPPSRFLTALTACSTRVPRACCIPLPAMRFAAFPARSASPPGGGLSTARLSRDAAHTLRRMFLVGSRTASPRPAALLSLLLAVRRRSRVAEPRLEHRGAWQARGLATTRSGISARRSRSAEAARLALRCTVPAVISPCLAEAGAARPPWALPPPRRLVDLGSTHPADPASIAGAPRPPRSSRSDRLQGLSPPTSP